ncbi:MAG: di-heme-cytochrome C peroxidase [Acetobacteraceae bacterium]
MKYLSPAAMVILAMLQAGCTPAENGTGDTGRQGWSDFERNRFYTEDQGARIMPLRWLTALKQPDGQSFLADKLARYGYLPNDVDLAYALPIGFTTNGPPGAQSVGMTCAACHTRQIEVSGTRHRIDGGPAIVDFQAFLVDLGTAVNTVLTDPAAFSNFAREVLNAEPAPAQAAALRRDVSEWYRRYQTLMTRSLPTPSWGPGRLDAVSMIFNRLTGLDIGTGPDGMIPENMRRADAPVRYPFLWNASRQDRTQWPGFAANGDDILGLARNLGEVYGVFAEFHPFKDRRKLLKVNYIDRNSANFTGLLALENLIERLEPPKYPWKIDAALAKEGEAIYGTSARAPGACWSCHGITPGEKRLLGRDTWATPVLDVGTDTRQYTVLATTVRTGVLSGAGVPFLIPDLKPTDTAFNTLRLSVVGAILQRIVSFTSVRPEQESAQGPESPGQTLLEAPASETARARLLAETPQAQTLKEAFNAPPPGEVKYEARVLQGIWAAAPYLHNGSVPTLADLLKPPAERPAAFRIGPEYDPDAVGLAVNQTRFTEVLQTTDCSDRNSGSSRCGHDYGTSLSPEQKRALLEYLKTL